MVILIVRYDKIMNILIIYYYIILIKIKIKIIIIIYNIIKYINILICAYRNLYHNYILFEG